MVSTVDIKPFGHGKPQLQATASQTTDASLSNTPPNRHTATSKFGSSTGSQTAPSRRKFMSPESSLRSRLPWLDGKPPSKAPTPIAPPPTKPGKPVAASESPSPASSPSEPLRRGSNYHIRKRLSTLAEPVPQSFHTPTQSPSSEYTRLHDESPSRKGSSRLDVSDVAPVSASSRRLSSRPEMGQVKTGRMPPVEHVRSRETAGVTQIPLGPSREQHPRDLTPRREKTSFEPPFKNNMGLIDAVQPFKTPPSPMCGPLRSTTSAALPLPPKQRLDDPITRPFNQELDRMEDLMRQAGDLIDEAAENGRPEEIREVSSALHNASKIAIHQQRQKPLRRRYPQSLSASSVSSSDSQASFSSNHSGAKIIGKDGPNSPSRAHVPTYASGALPRPRLGEGDSDASPRRGRARRRSSFQRTKTLPVAISGTATRDFAHEAPQQPGRDWKYDRDHDLGTQEPRKQPAAINVPIEDLHQPIASKPYTAYLADSPSPKQRLPPMHNQIYVANSDTPSPTDTTLRHRKVGTQDHGPPDPRVRRRHSSSSDFGQDNYTWKTPTREITPVPWKYRVYGKTSSPAEDSHNTLDNSQQSRGVDPEKHAGLGKPRHRWHLGHARHEPIARKWSTFRKRFSASVACLNTALVGYILGVYAGMVPRIQFQLADQKHYILTGNIYMYIGLSLTTFFAWPLPLLHGRKPYILAALAIALPLQFPQAILVSANREPSILGYDLELLICRLLNGFVLGLTNMNDFAVLLDLFGASLMSEKPHQEMVVHDDPRRDGGGLGLWLGFWVWCFIGSISLGFLSGASIIFSLNPSWGFYVLVILIACVLVLNVIAPETRRSAYRHHWREYIDHEERVHRKIARGEIKLHISDEGPKHCFQELWAGVILSKRMFMQRGFLVLALYLGWIYGQNILLIVLLGALLSRHYRLPSEFVGLGVFAISIGALIAVPLTKANIFSRARKSGPRTDSMTFERQVTWSSHLVRRTAFMLLLPITGVVYTVVSPGIGIHPSVPILFAAAIGFFDALAIAECYGLIMETWDVSDLQPGVNTKHRVQSMSETQRRRRTTYSCFPRVMSGVFVSQSIGFLLAAGATGLGGVMTRNLGAQLSTGITAGMLFVLTLLLTGTLWRFKSMQVIPNHAFGTKIRTGEWDESQVDEYWRPVVVGNPSGKIRRMSLLELGTYTRWTEIRRLNKLI